MMKKRSNILHLVRPYWFLLLLLVLFTLLSSWIELLIPRIVGESIDSYSKGTLHIRPVVQQLLLIIGSVLLFTYLRGFMQVFASERVAHKTRTLLAERIAGQDNSFVERITPVRLLANLSHDVDAIKHFLSQTLVTIFSSLFVISGAAICMVQINWKLAVYVLAVIPMIGVGFMILLRRVKELFRKSRSAFDDMNLVVSENVLGAALVRTLDACVPEYRKFENVNAEIKDIEFTVLRLFSLLIPMIRFTGNIAGLAILILGGHMVIRGELSLGDFAAFNSYLGMIILPVFTLGMMGNVVGQATTCYERISGILEADDRQQEDTSLAEPVREIVLEQVQLVYNGRPVLKDISMRITAGSRVAVIGPTTAGKTQLLYLVAGFINPTAGMLVCNGKPADSSRGALYGNQAGFVFQDSFILNTTLRDNIAFDENTNAASLQKAIETAELGDFIATLPKQLDTIISERGSSLSGGQKQRIMLARALAGNPSLLLLDDFLARVDINTGRKILGNIARNYPGITIISVAQKIGMVEDYDQILLLIHGELVASGRHEELMAGSEEYVKLYNLQRSTRNYEL